MKKELEHIMALILSSINLKLNQTCKLFPVTLLTNSIVKHLKQTQMILIENKNEYKRINKFNKELKEGKLKHINSIEFSF